MMHFKQVTTDAAFKTLLMEVGHVGTVYGSAHKVNKGDVTVIDWVPGKGISATINGKPMTHGGRRALVRGWGFGLGSGAG